MTNESARIILLQMLDGIDPTTGEVLPGDHLLSDATVMRAIHTAVLALTDISHPVRAPVNRNGRLNGGRPWTAMDRDALARLSRSGASMEMMCEKLQRRRRGVERQLHAMGLLPPPAETDLRRAGSLWTQEDEEQLRKLCRLRRPVEEMARELQRSVRAVCIRMSQLGLYGEEPGYPRRPGRKAR